MSGLFFLSVATDHGVELAVRGELGEVAAVLLEHRPLLALLLGATEAGHAHACRGGLTRRALGVLAGELAHGVAHRIAGDAHLPEGVHRASVALGHDAEQQVLGRNVGLAVRHRLAIGALEDALGTRGKRDVPSRDRLVVLVGQATHGSERLVIGDVELGERLGGDALTLLDEREQQVLGAHVHLAEVARLVLGEAHDLARLVGELLEHLGAVLSKVVSQL